MAKINTLVDPFTQPITHERSTSTSAARSLPPNVGSGAHRLTKSISQPYESGHEPHMPVVGTAVPHAHTALSRGSNLSGAARQPLRRRLTRAQSIKEAAENFFGLAPATPLHLCGQSEVSGTLPTPAALQVQYEQVGDQESSSTQREQVDAVREQLLEEARREFKWQRRRIRHTSRRYGAVRQPPEDHQFNIANLYDDSDSLQYDGVQMRMAPPSAGTMTSLSSQPAAFSTFLSDGRPVTPGTAPVLGTKTMEGISRSLGRSMSGSQTALSLAPNMALERRDSVAKMAWDGLTTLWKKTGSSKQPGKSPNLVPAVSSLRRGRTGSRSFTPASIMDGFETMMAGDDGIYGQQKFVFGPTTSGEPPPPVPKHRPSEICSTSQARTGVDSQLPLERIAEGEEDLSRLGSHAALEQYEGQDESVLREEEPFDRDAHPDEAFVYEQDVDTSPRSDIEGRSPYTSETPLSLADDVFFDTRPPPPPPHRVGAPASADLTDGGRMPPVMRSSLGAGLRPLDNAPLAQAHFHMPPPVPPHHDARPHQLPKERREPVHDRHRRHAHGRHEEHVQKRLAPEHVSVPTAYRQARLVQPLPPPGRPRVRRLKHKRRLPAPVAPGKVPIAAAEGAWPQWWSTLSLRSPANAKRGPAAGIMGKIFGRDLKRRSELSEQAKRQLDSYEDYRPFFTYWVTTVQIVVTLLAVILYGIGPVGFGRTQYVGQVEDHTRDTLRVAYYEQDNLWLGPRYSDLVVLGAKYSPCMRTDPSIYRLIGDERRRENKTSCCIYNDGSGCYQSTRCPSLIASHATFDRHADGRTTGVVCGQDPDACERPASISPFEWPDDLTKWPVCTHSVVNSTLPHMSCMITGRPCCIGIRGQCRIASKEYCDFVKGKFHEEATLCSQVSCLEEVCGMIPFLRHDKPDQFYRPFLSLFLHAGLIHLLFTCVLQYIFMRDLEKLIGWHRIGIIYIVSGVCGNLASANFVPYMPGVGPSASQCGLLATLFADAIYGWEYIKEPWKAMVQLSIVALILFVVGLVPWIDNWAQIFGFIAGLALSLALLRYIQFDGHNRRQRLIIVLASLLFSAGLLAVLLVLFYVIPLSECAVCVYLNCIRLPFIDRHFCDNQGLTLKHYLPI